MYFEQIPASNPEDRPVYIEEFGCDSQWYLPVDYNAFCVENYMECVSNPSVITALQLASPTKGAKFYFAVHNANDDISSESSELLDSDDDGGNCRDFAIVVGTTDNILGSDWAHLGAISEFTIKGRTVSDKCSDPK